MFNVVHVAHRKTTFNQYVWRKWYELSGENPVLINEQSRITSRHRTYLNIVENVTSNFGYDWEDNYKNYIFLLYNSDFSSLYFILY